MQTLNEISLASFEVVDASIRTKTDEIAKELSKRLNRIIRKYRLSNGPLLSVIQSHITSSATSALEFGLISEFSKSSLRRACGSK